MALTKWNPLLADLATTRERFNRLFGRDDPWETEGVTTGGEWSPTVDIVENDHALTVKAVLPGLDPRDVGGTVDQSGGARGPLDGTPLPEGRATHGQGGEKGELPSDGTRVWHVCPFVRPARFRRR